jgi:hypothetical protein
VGISIPPTTRAPETKDFMPRTSGKRVESRPGGEGITISPEYVRDTLFLTMYAAIGSVDPTRPSGGDDAAGAVFTASLHGVFLPNSVQDPTGVVEWGIVVRTNAWFRRFLDWKGYAHASVVSVRLDRCRGIGAEVIPSFLFSNRVGPWEARR